MGRPPRGRWRVAATCHLGLPTVIENHPVDDEGKPFPTLYWLTCPVLVKRVGTLEASGAMADLNDQMSRDPAMRRRLEEALVRYREQRDWYGHIDDAQSPPGGSPGRIKCLHAHTAHELAGGGNPVGAIALTATGWPDCVSPCVEVNR